jgi:hypothetical protein
LYYTVVGPDPDKGCTVLKLTLDEQLVDWCMTPQGVLIEFVVKGNPSFHIRRVSGEQEALAFLKGVMPKKSK